MAAACGGTGGEERTAPTLPPALADDLAARADAVADRLAAGDPCAAAADADDLVHRTVEAIQAGQVPPALQEELLAGAQELLQGIDCPVAEPPADPAPPPATEPEPGAEREDEAEDEDDEEDADDDEDDDGEGRRGRGPPDDPPGQGRGRERG